MQNKICRIVYCEAIIVLYFVCNLQAGKFAYALIKLQCRKPAKKMVRSLTFRNFTVPDIKCFLHKNFMLSLSVIDISLDNVGGWCFSRCCCCCCCCCCSCCWWCYQYYKTLKIINSIGKLAACYEKHKISTSNCIFHNACIQQFDKPATWGRIIKGRSCFSATGVELWTGVIVW